MGRLTVKTRVAATSVALLAVSLGVVTVVVTHSTGATAQRAAELVTSETAGRFAAQTKADLDEAFATARDLRSTLTGLRAAGGTRAQAERVERNLLEGHETYLGVWSGWEPDAFDAQDKRHVTDASSDSSGRFVTYWYRDGAQIASAPLVDYGTPGDGDYYQLPLTTGKDKVLDPYEYEVGGKTVLMTSVTAPIEVGGRVVGVSGVDIALSELQAKVAQVQVYGTGSATLVSSSGAVVAAPDRDAVGEPVDDAMAAAVRAAQGGLSRTTVTTGAGEVLRVAAPIRLSEQDTWTLVVDVPQTAVTADARALRTTILLVAGLSLLLAAAVALAAARRLVRPIDVLQRRMAEISEGDGDLTQRVDESRDDEIGALGHAFNRFAEKVAGTIREITQTSHELGASASSLQEVAQRLESGATATSAGTAQLADASRQVDASVQSLAAGAEEMGVTAREIAANASRAAQMATTSVSAAAAATTTIGSLGTSSAEIGDVVKVIMGIAAQTNLLALNATIEAARAGEAGKGFAVVAGEVKDLAQETSRATENIVARVQAIQAAAVQAGDALDRISRTINSVDQEQTAIAAAVEEQAVTAESMAKSITLVADGTTRTTHGLGDVDRTAVLNSAAASDTTVAAQGLQRTAERLRCLVADFRC